METPRHIIRALTSTAYDTPDATENSENEQNNSNVNGKSENVNDGTKGVNRGRVSSAITSTPYDPPRDTVNSENQQNNSNVNDKTVSEGTTKGRNEGNVPSVKPSEKVTKRVDIGSKSRQVFFGNKQLVERGESKIMPNILSKIVSSTPGPEVPKGDRTVNQTPRVESSSAEEATPRTLIRGFIAGTQNELSAKQPKYTPRTEQPKDTPRTEQPKDIQGINQPKDTPRTLIRNVVGTSVSSTPRADTLPQTMVEYSETPRGNIRGFLAHAPSVKTSVKTKKKTEPSTIVVESKEVEVSEDVDEFFAAASDDPRLASKQQNQGGNFLEDDDDDVGEGEDAFRAIEKELKMHERAIGTRKEFAIPLARKREQVSPGSELLSVPSSSPAQSADGHSPVVTGVGPTPSVLPRTTLLDGSALQRRETPLWQKPKPPRPPAGLFDSTKRKPSTALRMLGAKKRKKRAKELVGGPRREMDTIDKSTPMIPLASMRRLFSNLVKNAPQGPTSTSTDAFPAVHDASKIFFEMISHDLGAYCNHAQRSKIEMDDIRLLMYRQRLVSQESELRDIVRKFLPREYAEQVHDELDDA